MLHIYLLMLNQFNLHRLETHYFARALIHFALNHACNYLNRSVRKRVAVHNYIAAVLNTKNEVIYECDAPIDIVLCAVCCFVLQEAMSM